MTDVTNEPGPVSHGLRPAYFYSIVALVFIGDQFSKAWIQKTMSFGDYRPVIGTQFMLTLTQNTGGAWGLLPEGNKVFIVFAAIAIVALLFAYHKMARADLLIGSAFALALGGALGNLLDRIRYGYVVDFFDARIIHWPIFNIADSAISLGIVLLLWHYIQSLKNERKDTQSAVREVAAPSSASLAADDLGKNAHE